MTLGSDQVLPHDPRSFVTFYIARCREIPKRRERQQASPGWLETERHKAFALVILFCFGIQGAALKLKIKQLLLEAEVATLGRRASGPDESPGRVLLECVQGWSAGWVNAGSPLLGGGGVGNCLHGLFCLGAEDETQGLTWARQV